MSDEIVHARNTRIGQFNRGVKETNSIVLDYDSNIEIIEALMKEIYIYSATPNTLGETINVLKADNNIEIVIDRSEAMSEPFGDVTKLEAAKHVLDRVFNLQVAEQDNLAFRQFGGPSCWGTLQGNSGYGRCCKSLSLTAMLHSDRVPRRVSEFVRRQ